MPMTEEERKLARKESAKRSNKKHADHVAAYQKKYREEHREQSRAYSREYHKTHKPKPRSSSSRAKVKPYMREFHLRKKYGITEDGYNRILEMQGGCCAICGTDDPHGRNHNRFHVDHCHKTNLVRGLLCSRCNLGLGSFQDNILLMKKAITYIVTRIKEPEDYD